MRVGVVIGSVTLSRRLENIAGGRFLIVSTIVVFAVAVLLPYVSIGTIFSFVPLPAPVLIAMLVITGLYIVASEMTKRWFYRRLA